MKKKIVFSMSVIMLLSTLFVGETFADWMNDGNGRYKYFNSATGQYVTNNWLQTGTGFYYFDASGYAVTGWYLINGKYYYFDQNGLMQVGFIEFNGKKYYLNPSNGQMVTGWIQTYTDGVLDYYYFNADGTMMTGWNKIGNSWFYFYDGKCLVDTFAAVNGIWYHFGISGAMDTGWVVEKGKMFYFNQSNGSLTKGWIQDQNGNEYYLSEVDGSLTINTTLQIGGTYYTFDSQGKCIAKDQYSFVGDASGNSSYYTGGVLGNKGTEVVYGVNVGVSPGVGAGVGGTTSFQYEQEQTQPLQAGSTTGPK